MTEDQQDQAVDALRLSWGEAYVIGVGLDGFWARRLDKLGGEIRAADPDELRRRVGEDYAVRSVRSRPVQ
jgi:hypothetical protein